MREYLRNLYYVVEIKKDIFVSAVRQKGFGKGIVTGTFLEAKEFSSRSEANEIAKNNNGVVRTVRVKHTIE